MLEDSDNDNVFSDSLPIVSNNKAVTNSSNNIPTTMQDIDALILENTKNGEVSVSRNDLAEMYGIAHEGSYIPEAEADDIIDLTTFSNIMKGMMRAAFTKQVSIRGVISDFNAGKGKGTFFKLNNGNSGINVVMWGSPGEILSNGDSVCVTGNVAYYEKKGYVQLDCKSIFKCENIESNYTRLNDVKIRLEKEGYFDITQKKNRNDLIASQKGFNIALLTSGSGAVIEDMKHVLDKSGFSGNVNLFNCAVQGNHCVRDFTSALNHIKQNHTQYDIVVLARGGGSFDDLAGFNDEVLAKQLYQFPVYTISAIGHETDHVLLDLVADVRAPTPSVAARMICDITREITRRLTDQIEQMRNDIISTLESQEQIYSTIVDDGCEESRTQFIRSTVTAMQNELVSIIDTNISLCSQFLKDNVTTPLVYNSLVTDMNNTPIMTIIPNSNIKIHFTNDDYFIVRT